MHFSGLNVGAYEYELSQQGRVQLGKPYAPRTACDAAAMCISTHNQKHLRYCTLFLPCLLSVLTDLAVVRDCRRFLDLDISPACSFWAALVIEHAKRRIRI
jgi:hypothetical protein